MSEKIMEKVNYGEAQQEMSLLKEIFDKRIEKVNNIFEAIDLHNEVKKALKEGKIEENYLKYIENAIEDTLFCDHKFDVVCAKTLIEILCPCLIPIKDLQIPKIEIEEIRFSL